MHKYPEHYRESEHSRLVWMARATAEVSTEEGVEVSAELPKRKKAVKETVSDLTYDENWPKEAKPGQSPESYVWTKIDAVYGKTPFQSLIREHVDKIMPGTAEGTYKQSLIRKSVARYMGFYRHIEGKFMVDAAELSKKFEWAKEHVREATAGQLMVLREAVEGSKEFHEFNEPMPPLSEKREVRKHFGRFVEALGGRYLNKHVNEGQKIPETWIPLIGPFIHPDKKVFQHKAHPEESVAVPLIGPVVGSDVFKGKEYEGLSRDFQKNMEDWVENKLDFLLEEPGTTQEDLVAFRGEIEQRYKLYARMDGSSDIVSQSELIVLNLASQLPENSIGLVLDSNNSTVFNRLEVIQLMDPSRWENLMEDTGEFIAGRAVSDAAQEQFIKTVNKDLKERGKETIKEGDFDEAEDAFMERLGALAKADVRKTIAYVRKFNREVHGELLQYEESITDESLETQTAKQLDYVLGSQLEAMKLTDRMLVDFMQANEEERMQILSDPGLRDRLFRGIRTATEVYPEAYEHDFGNIPDDPTKLRRAWNIEKATRHDKAAQLQALIILGHQAEVIVDRYSRKPEFRDMKLMEEMARADIPEDPSVVKLGLGFKRPGRKPLLYQSALSRGGFNGRDLALKGAKVLGILIVASNVAQSFSETEGDFLDRVFDTVERAASNPSLLAGVGVVAGAHMAERNKAFLRYPWLSQYERQGVWTAYKLDNLRARVGKDETNRFLQNGAEWRALNEPSMDPTAIKELLKKADERKAKGAYAVITPKDIQEVIGDNRSIISGLTSGGKSGRMRYLFYKKFFSGSKKPSVHDVKALCTGNDIILDQPDTLT